MLLTVLSCGAMLPLGDRVASTPRSKYLPSRNRGIPVPKEPTTIGGHLRKRRLHLRIIQSEAARRLDVSTRTVSLWECDRLHPVWAYWPRIVDYLGFDPFTDSALGRPTGNESQFVASLSHTHLNSLGKQIIGRRQEMRKSRKELAKELGVSLKTLWGWETNRRQPSETLRERIKGVVSDGKPSWR